MARTKLVEEFCMDLWRDLAGLSPIPDDDVPSLETLQESEWSPEFERLMRLFLVMGALRYDSYYRRRSNPDYTAFNWAQTAIKKLQRYLSTGDRRLLIDAANYCMTEYEWGRHPLRHFSTFDFGQDRARRQ